MLEAGFVDLQHAQTLQTVPTPRGDGVRAPCMIAARQFDAIGEVSSMLPRSCEHRACLRSLGFGGLQSGEFDVPWKSDRIFNCVMWVSFFLLSNHFSNTELTGFARENRKTDNTKNTVVFAFSRFSRFSRFCGFAVLVLFVVSFFCALRCSRFRDVRRCSLQVSVVTMLNGLMF